MSDVLWTGDCVCCGQRERLGYSRRHEGFHCCACHDYFDSSSRNSSLASSGRAVSSDDFFVYSIRPPFSSFADQIVVSAGSSKRHCGRGTGASLWISAELLMAHMLWFLKFDHFASTTTTEAVKNVDKGGANSLLGGRSSLGGGPGTSTALISNKGYAARRDLVSRAVTLVRAKLLREDQVVNKNCHVVPQHWKLAVNDRCDFLGDHVGSCAVPLSSTRNSHARGQEQIVEQPHQVEVGAGVLDHAAAPSSPSAAGTTTCSSSALLLQKSLYLHQLTRIFDDPAAVQVADMNSMPPPALVCSRPAQGGSTTTSTTALGFAGAGGTVARSEGDGPAAGRAAETGTRTGNNDQNALCHIDSVSASPPRSPGGSMKRARDNHEQGGEPEAPLQAVGRSTLVEENKKNIDTARSGTSATSIPAPAGGVTLVPATAANIQLVEDRHQQNVPTLVRQGQQLLSSPVSFVTSENDEEDLDVIQDFYNQENEEMSSTTASWVDPNEQEDRYRSLYDDVCNGDSRPLVSSMLCGPDVEAFFLLALEQQIEEKRKLEAELAEANRAVVAAPVPGSCSVGASSFPPVPPPISQSLPPRQQSRMSGKIKKRFRMRTDSVLMELGCGLAQPSICLGLNSLANYTGNHPAVVNPDGSVCSASPMASVAPVNPLFNQIATSAGTSTDRDVHDIDSSCTMLMQLEDGRGATKIMTASLEGDGRGPSRTVSAAGGGAASASSTTSAPSHPHHKRASVEFDEDRGDYDHQDEDNYAHLGVLLDYNATDQNAVGETSRTAAARSNSTTPGSSRTTQPAVVHLDALQAQMERLLEEQAAGKSSGTNTPATSSHGKARKIDDHADNFLVPAGADGPANIPPAELKTPSSSKNTVPSNDQSSDVLVPAGASSTKLKAVQHHRFPRIVATDMGVVLPITEENVEWNFRYHVLKEPVRFAKPQNQFNTNIGFLEREYRDSEADNVSMIGAGSSQNLVNMGLMAGGAAGALPVPTNYNLSSTSRGNMNVVARGGTRSAGTSGATSSTTTSSGAPRTTIPGTTSLFLQEHPSTSSAAARNTPQVDGSPMEVDAASVEPPPIFSGSSSSRTTANGEQPQQDAEASRCLNLHQSNGGGPQSNSKLDRAPSWTLPQGPPPQAAQIVQPGGTSLFGGGSAGAAGPTHGTNVNLLEGGISSSKAPLGRGHGMHLPHNNPMSSGSEVNHSGTMPNRTNVGATSSYPPASQNHLQPPSLQRGRNVMRTPQDHISQTAARQSPFGGGPFPTSTYPRAGKRSAENLASLAEQKPNYSFSAKDQQELRALDVAQVRQLQWGEKEQTLNLIQEFGQPDFLIGSSLCYDEDFSVSLLETFLQLAKPAVFWEPEELLFLRKKVLQDLAASSPSTRNSSSFFPSSRGSTRRESTSTSQNKSSPTTLTTSLLSHATRDVLLHELTEDELQRQISDNRKKFAAATAPPFGGVVLSSTSEIMSSFLPTMNEVRVNEDNSDLSGTTRYLRSGTILVLALEQRDRDLDNFLKYATEYVEAGKLVMKLVKTLRGTHAYASPTKIYECYVPIQVTEEQSALDAVVGGGNRAAAGAAGGVTTPVFAPASLAGINYGRGAGASGAATSANS
ncbi:unnamed protein product [Amoebophrya sp. A120]|nr:unnamed protein product [Amoebophrya sp. A120]|eukprot:GSA120T00017153001.1